MDKVIICGQCGKENSENDLMCANCGAILEGNYCLLELLHE